jgi:hypothetical protein
MTKPLAAKFTSLVERAFSLNMEKLANHDSNKYQHLFKEEYDSAIKIVVSVKDADVLSELMKAYLGLYDRYSANKDNIHFYRSDQLFELLVEQSAKVVDQSLFETWDTLFRSSDQTQGFNRRVTELNPTSKQNVKNFFTKERERRRGSRSILDLLKDEYVKKYKQSPTNEQLYQFDPKLGSDAFLFENQVVAIRQLWNVSSADFSKDTIDGLSAVLDVFSRVLRSQAKTDVLVLFQFIKDLQGLMNDKIERKSDPKTGRTEAYRTSVGQDEKVLLRGLYAIACIQLMVIAQADRLYARNRNGFTAEETAYFYAPVAKDDFYYASNIRKVLTPPLKEPETTIAEIKTFLSTYILTKNQLAGFKLERLDKTLEIQSKWLEIRNVTDLIQLAAKRSDISRLNEIFADPRNEKGITYLKEISSTVIEAKNPWALGQRTLAAGSKLGDHSTYGEIVIVYIDSKDKNQVFIELSSLKPQLFLVDEDYVAHKVMGEKLLEIYRSTIGMVYVTNIIFMAMGFLPVLIEAGFAGLIYEIALFYTSNVVEEQASKVNPKFGKFLGLLIQTFAPRPSFKPKFVGEVERADKSALSDVLNFPGKDKSSFLNPENRGLDHLSEAELDGIMEEIPVFDDVIESHMGVTYGDVRQALRKLGYTEIKNPWRQIISQSEPLRKMIAAADDVTFVRLTGKQLKAPHIQFQQQTMGLDIELHITIDGQRYQLDGVVIGANGKSWIGETKFTYKDAWDEAYASFYAEGKANPATSFHTRFLDEKVLPQFGKYAKLAKRFGFEGVAVFTNTEYLWATFEQTTRYKNYIDVFLQEFETASASKIQAAARGTKKLGAGSRITK